MGISADMKLFTAQYAVKTGWTSPLQADFDSPNTLLIIFGPSDLDMLRPAITELRKTYARSVWIGSSTAGEIFGSSLTDNSLTISLIRFEKTAIAVANCEVHQGVNSQDAGRSIAKQLIAPDLKGVLVFSDGLSVNGSELADGMASAFPKSVVVTGGLAADDSKFERTWTTVDKEFKPNHVSAVGFYGDHVGIAYGSRGGWDVLGPERRVTRSHSNVLYELDGQPALALYKKYLGDRAASLPASGLLFPLAIRNDSEQDGLTVRTILSVNETDQSITFAGNIPQDVMVRLMHANFDRLIDGASDAAKAIQLGKNSSGVSLAVAVSCVGRRLVLGQRCEEEIEAVIDHLPSECKLVGYYSYGELSPLMGGRCDLHNQTMTLTLLWENGY